MSTIIRGGLIARNRSPLIQADGLREFLKWKQENVREAAIAGPYGNYRAGQQLFTLPDFHLCDSYVGCSPLSAHQVPHLVLSSCFPTALTCMWLWYKSQPQWHTVWCPHYSTVCSMSTRREWIWLTLLRSNVHLQPKQLWLGGGGRVTWGSK